MERKRASDEEKITPKRVEEKLDELAVDFLLIDLDDTLCLTREIFLVNKELFLDLVSEKTDLDKEPLSDSYKEIDKNLYRKIGVNPKRLSSIIQALKEKYEHKYDEVFDEGFPILKSIYTTKPRLINGAVETLEILAKTDRKLILATHANEEWTDFKVDILGLRKYFDGRVKILNENKHKTSEEWEKTVIKPLSINPKRALVLGDNLPGDIIATHNLGVKHLFYIDVGEIAWEVYREGEIPEGTVIIPSIKEFLPKLLSL